MRVFAGPIAAGPLELGQAVAQWIGHAHPDDSFGAALDAGEIDGDGRADLVVGAPTEPNEWNAPAGRIYFLTGGGL